MYLVVILDLYSRKVLSWRLSNTRDTDFCIEALDGHLKSGVFLLFLILIRDVSILLQDLLNVLKSITFR